MAGINGVSSATSRPASNPTPSPAETAASKPSAVADATAAATPQVPAVASPADGDVVPAQAQLADLPAFQAGPTIGPALTTPPPTPPATTPGTDIAIGAEVDLVGITGVVFGGGLVIDTGDWRDAGLYVSGGVGGGANVGAGVGVTVVPGGDIEGQSVEFDVNGKVVSGTLGATDTGSPVIGVSVGPGLGASGSVSQTYSYTVGDAIDHATAAGRWVGDKASDAWDATTDAWDSTTDAIGDAFDQLNDPNNWRRMFGV